MTIAYAPPKIIAARNPTWLEVHCDNAESSPATAAVTVLSFVGEPSAGQKITVQLPGGATTVLEAVSGTPDSSGTQYTIGMISGETIENLVATANLNFQLLEHYTIEYDGGTAVFTARVPGANAPLFLFDDPAWGVALPASAGAAAVVPVGYQAGLVLWVEEVWDSGVYTRLRELVFQRDELGNFREDLATMLLPYCGYTWMPYAGTAVHRTTALQRRWYVDVWEAWGDPITPRAVLPGNTNIRTAWYAGTRNSQQVAHWTRFVDRIRPTNVTESFQSPWLTYRGQQGRHEVSPAQQHYLAWYQRVASGHLGLKCTVLYTDGTTDATTFTDDVVLQGEIGHWPTGFEQIGLDALQPDKEPYAYIVQLLRDGVPVSEAHTFYLVEEDTNELHIEFISSLGAQESMRCTGAWSDKAKAEHADVRQVLDVRAGVAPASHRSAGRSLLLGVQHVLHADTGWIDAGERDALLDVLHAPEIRLVLHDTGRHMPLRLAGSEQTAGQVGTPEEHLHRLRFQFLLHDADMAWSNMPLYSTLTFPPTYPEEETE